MKKVYSTPELEEIILADAVLTDVINGSKEFDDTNDNW